MNIVMRKLDEISPYERNPRKNDGAVEYVANSIKEFGFKVPIVIDKDGVIVAAAVVDMRERMLVSQPIITSKGFVFVKEAEELISEMESVMFDALCFALNRKDCSVKAVRDAVSDKLSDFLYKKTKRSPVIVPIITEVR